MCENRGKKKQPPCIVSESGGKGPKLTVLLNLMEFLRVFFFYILLNFICCVLLYCQVMDPSFRAPFGNVNRWFLTTVNQPQFKKILGEVKLCETMAKFDGGSCAIILLKVLFNLN